MLNYLLFPIVFIFFYLVIFSYGIQLKKIFFNKINFSTGEIGILGFLAIYIFATGIHFISNISQEISLLIYAMAVCIFIYNFTSMLKIFINESKPILLLLVISIFFSITTNLHDDVNLYQLPTINYFQQNKIIFGVHGFFDVLAYGHGFYNIMSVFQLPIIQNAAIYFLPVIFLNFFLLACYSYYKKSDNALLKLFLFIIFLIICFRYTRFSTYGADIAPLCIIFLLQIYTIDFLKKNNFDNLEKFIIFFTFGIFLKIYVISSVFLFLLFIFILKKKLFSILLKNSFFISIIIFVIGGSNNFINSGCLYYPVSITCFEKKIITWSVGKEVSKAREAKQTAEAKGIKAYVRLAKFSNDKFSYIQNIEPTRYLEKFKYSYLKHIPFDADFKRILVIFVIVIFIFIFSIISKKSNKLSINKKNIMLLNLASSFCFVMWLTIGPQSRYGGTAILSFFLFTIFFINGHARVNLLNKKIFNFIFLFALFFFLGKNFSRIHKEINADKFILMKNYPFATYKKIDFISKARELFILNITYNIEGCGNVKFPCTHNEYANSIIEAKKVGGYLFLKSNDDIPLKAIQLEHRNMNHIWNNG